jgi:predicted GNAT family N-acyltransferase
MDSFDEGAIHMIMREEDNVIGTFRGTGAGSFLMNAAAEHIRKCDSKIKEIAIHSQVQVVEFYSKLGYQVKGASFIEDGIWHKKMTLALYK